MRAHSGSLRHFNLAIAVTGVAAAPVVAAPVVNPGEWETRIVVEQMVMPGMPPGALDAMKGQPTVVRSCMTPQDAEARPEKLLNADKNCTAKRFNFAAGRIDAELVCRTPQGPATITMAGSFTPTTTTMQSRMVSGPMTMVSRVSSRRLGPCK